MKNNNLLGIQTWCFRNFTDVNVMLSMLKQTGGTVVEMAGKHCDFKNVEAHKKVIEAHKKAGVKIVGSGVNRLSLDEAQDRLFFEFLKSAGAKHMSFDFNTDRLEEQIKLAEKLTEEYGITLGIHNHGGKHWLGSIQALKWIFGKCSKRIGLSFDTAWALQSQEDVCKMLEEFKDRVFLLHLKDFIFDRSGKLEDVIVGTGNMDLKKIRTTLDNINYKGPLIIEYEGHPEAPVPVLIECVKNIKEAMY